MVSIYNLEQIKESLESIDLAEIIAAGFVDYSQGKAVIPPVGELVFTAPPGDTHIKYGYIKGRDNYVVKVASGFYQNNLLGLPSGSGLMLVFSQKTGFLQSILLDDGYLTNVRTAVAGLLCSRLFAPQNITSIGILGTGEQARLQAIYSARETGVTEIKVWGRNISQIDTYVSDMQALGFTVSIKETPAQLAAACRLIITTTPAEFPLLQADDIRPGTHITAIGSDTPEKQEMAIDILAKADLLVTDSLIQCQSRGEIAQALKAEVINLSQVQELGNIIMNPEKTVRKDGEISVADLTGVAVQDIQIATAVCNSIDKEQKNA